VLSSCPQVRLYRKPEEKTNRGGSPSLSGGKERNTFEGEGRFSGGGISWGGGGWCLKIFYGEEKERYKPREKGVAQFNEEKRGGGGGVAFEKKFVGEMG